MGSRPVTLTARVRDAAGHVTATTTSLTVGRPALLGWCPPDSTTTDLTAMLGAFPNPKVVRLYTGIGGGLASWSSGPLSMVPATSVCWYSFKDWVASSSPQKIRDWLSARPIARRGVVDVVTLDHEPEQQDSGDPTPAQFRQEWAEFTAALAGHPRRSEVRLVPVFTEYYARRTASWWSDFGQVAALAGVNGVGFDIYDTGYSTYRSVMERNEFALATARRAEVRKPLLIAEWGIARKTGDDGSGAAKAMRDNMAYLRSQPDVDLVSWFYRGGCDLTSRGPERQAFVELMG
ncbi:hypothetical protein ACN27B_08690 [Micromonospora sp. WMMD754]|uniref:hypothetical protein n=1 Tax=Micromonospora sp. WMMD754 TaxID=3404114 RepID=UPI003BF4EF58